MAALPDYDGRREKGQAAGSGRRREGGSWRRRGERGDAGKEKLNVEGENVREDGRGGGKVCEIKRAKSRDRRAAEGEHGGAGYHSCTETGTPDYRVNSSCGDQMDETREILKEMR